MIRLVFRNPRRLWHVDLENARQVCIVLAMVKKSQLIDVIYKPN